MVCIFSANLDEEVSESLEVGSVERVVRPTLQHQLEDVGGNVFRFGQTLALLVDFLQDLTIAQHFLQCIVTDIASEFDWFVKITQTTLR